MKKLYRITVLMLVVILLVFVFLSVYYSRMLDRMVEQKQNSGNSKNPPKYHFAAILHKTEDPYWKGIENGINEACAKNNIACEIDYVQDSDENHQTLMYLDMAIMSNVDGIVTPGYDTDEFIKLAEEANKKGIPIVTIDTDSPRSKRSTFVEVNGFELGSLAGKEIIKAMNGSANVAIIVKDDQKNKSDNVNTIVSGFIDATKDHRNIKLVTVKKSDFSVLSAKDVLQNIINNYHEVNSVICTGADDTIGVAQQVVDYNMVGNYTIIGYENSEEILKYIQKGVVYSSLVPDPLKTGSNSIDSLIECKQKGKTSSLILTDINIVDKQNVEKYINNLQKEMKKTQ